jgi:hypothetical protein
MAAPASAPTASFLPGEDPDIVEANRRYQEALATLTQSLDVRKNRLFDPVMLAMAEGFLSPTQTGSFGESLGKVAGKVGPAEAASMKEQQDIAQQKLAVAGQGLELQRLKARDAELARFLGEGPSRPAAGPAAGPLAGPQAGAIAGPQAGPLSTAPTAPAAPAGPLTAAAGEQVAPPITPPTGTVSDLPPGGPRGPERPMAAAVPPAAPAAAPAAGPLTTQARMIAPQATTGAAPRVSDKPVGFENVEGIQVAPANPNFMTARDYIRLNRFDKNKSPGDLIKEAQEIEQKRYRDKEGGVLDLATGRYYQYPTGKTEEIQLYGYPGTYRVDARTAAQLSLYAANNDPKYHDLAERVVKGPERRKPEGEGKPGEGGKPGEPPRLRSQSELDLDKQRKEALQKAEVEMEVAARKDFDQRRRDADDTITTANLFRRFAADPNAAKMVGILNNDKISSGIATLVRDGVGVPGFSIGTKSIEDVMRNAGLNAADQAKYRTFLMYATTLQLQQSKYMKGAVSDYEQRLMANAVINAQDTPETIRMKADLLTRRAQFDRRVAKAFKDSKMTADEFLDSDTYEKMRDKYNEDLADLASGSKILAAPPKPAAGGATAPSEGFIRDPKTGVIRRKQPGE